MTYVNANPVSKACRRMGASEMALAWNPASPPVPLSNWTPGTTVPGSLGTTYTSGDFYMEMTEPTQGPMLSGNDTMNGMCPVEFTVTAYGITRPQNTGSNTTALYAGQGVEVARARIIGGPVQWTGCGGK
jgi:hypothetical protein